MRRIHPVIFFLLICTACGTPAPRETASPDAARRAAELSSAGQHLQAAEEYLRLAELYPKESSGYQLRAAHSYLDAGDANTAAPLIEGIKPQGKIETHYRTLLQAQLALNAGLADSALERVAAAPAGTPVFLQALRHRIRAQALDARGDHAAAVQAYAALEKLAAGAEERRGAALGLWRNLVRLDGDDLRALAGSGDPSLGSWAELALMQRMLIEKPDVLRQSLASWIAAHPGHPAVPSITDEMQAAVERYSSAPGHIALLLPLTGQFAGAAAAIRDGFLSAWLTEAEYKPRISIRDANALDIVDEYRAAVDGGADFVVGPLEKNAVAALIESGDLPVMTLALNYTDGPAGEAPPAGTLPTLIEFGLKPEDEAVQAARRGVFDGHRSAAILVPDNDWGTRLGRAFADEWRAYGGRVVEEVRYPTNTADFSGPVKELLNIDSSEVRKASLRQRMGRRFEGGARSREDVDMIFLAAVPLYARQIVPQFRYHGVDQIPVFSSSHIYTGTVDASTGADMDGVRFPDMPWILEPRQEDVELRGIIDDNWPADASNFRRLFGFGIDAFRIIRHLPRLILERGSTWSGETGELQSGGDGRLHRKLLWARFVDGRPRLLDEQ